MVSPSPIVVAAVVFQVCWSAADAGAGDADISAAENPKSPRVTGVCIKKEIADRLAIKRKRRGAVDRLFVKQARHELATHGGYYVSDLFSSTYTLGGSYTYHMTEATAVELSYSFTHANADVIRAIESSRGSVIDDPFAPVHFVDSLLVFTPVYGKLRLGGSIVRFDIHIDAGVGVVQAQTSRGAAAVSGLGFKMFFQDAFALRLDARDHVFHQELLDRQFLVNDFSLVLGLSLFLPFRN